MPQCLANGDDPNEFIALGVHKRNHDSLKHSKSDVPEFAVVLPRILDSDQWPSKDPFRIAKIDAMLGEIGYALLFIPREHVGNCSYNSPLRQGTGVADAG